jgi:hypothetical protein
MNDYNSFSKSSLETLHVILESEKFKAYLLNLNTKAIDISHMFKDNNFSLFEAEIFQFWLQAKTHGNVEKQEFINYAKEISIPVIDHDKKDLSWFGEDLFNIWSESIKQKMLK